VRAKRTFSVVILAALVATGCSSSPRSSTQSVDPAVVERIIANCTNLNAPELGEGKLCIDNGFRISDDDFTFANWGRSLQADANVTVQTLVDLFGRNTVCTSGPDNECVLRPATLQKLEEWNTALSGGRCEGLSTLSTRFFMNLDHPSMFRPDASAVADLRRGDGTLDAALVYWWATQFLPEVADRAAASRQRTPLELVGDVIVGLANSVGYTVGMYFGTTGHSVTPFAVSAKPRNVYARAMSHTTKSKKDIRSGAESCSPLSGSNIGRFKITSLRGGGCAASASESVSPVKSKGSGGGPLLPSSAPGVSLLVKNSPASQLYP
jgi:hypothetical protein